MASPSTAPPSDPPHSGSDRARWLGMVVISLGVSLIVVDATIVNVLLPRIVTELGLRTTDAEWVTAIYSLVFAAFLIPAGRAGDAYGRRRLFVAGTVVFVSASLLAATSNAGDSLIMARAVQGVGAAMIMPAALSTVNTVFTGRDRAVAFGIWGSLIGGMAAVGPLLGGWLATSFGWRWAFGINLPLGIALVAGALLLMPETRRRPESGGGTRTAGGRIGGGADRAGGVLSVLAMSGLVFGLIEGQTYGWLTPTRTFTAGPFTWPLAGLSPVPVALAGGAVLLAALVVVERVRAAAGRPVLLDLTLFQIASYRRGNLASALISVGELGLLFVLPLFLEGVHGDSPLQISVAILPLAIGAFLAGPFAGRLSHRHGPARVVQLGMLLEVLAVLAIGLTVHADSSGYSFAPWMLMYGLGLGLTSAQLTNISLGGVPREKAGQASGTQSTSRQLGSALGIAIVGAVFATSLSHTMIEQLRPAHALSAAERTAYAHDLRESAGTYARKLHEQPAMAVEARAADESLAVATRRGALTTAAVLLLGLLVALRLSSGDSTSEPATTGHGHRSDDTRTGGAPVSVDHQTGTER